MAARLNNIKNYALFDADLLSGLVLTPGPIIITNPQKELTKRELEDDVVHRIYKVVQQVYGWMQYPDAPKERKARHPVIMQHIHAAIKSGRYDKERITDKEAEQLIQYAGYGDAHALNFDIGEMPFNYSNLCESSLSPELKQEWGYIAATIIGLLRLHFHGNKPPADIMPRYPGIDLASFFVEETHVGIKASRIKNTLWPKYRCVAHLITAWEYWKLSRPIEERNIYDWSELHQFLSCACSIRKVLCSMKNQHHGKAKTLFRREQFLSIPKYSHDIPEIVCDETVVSPFSNEEWKKLQSYRAQ